MTLLRKSKFLQGIALGGIGGLLLGTLIALVIGETRVKAVRNALQGRLPNSRKVPFQYLSQ